MKISYELDSQLNNTVVLRFSNGWTWQEHYEILKQIGRDRIGMDSRIDYILDFRDVWTFPRMRLPVHIRQAEFPDLGFPRRGGISIYAGTGIYLRALLISVGRNIDHRAIRRHIVPNLDYARELIQQHRRDNNSVSI